MKNGYKSQMLSIFRQTINLPGWQGIIFFEEGCIEDEYPVYWGSWKHQYAKNGKILFVAENLKTLNSRRRK